MDCKRIIENGYGRLAEKLPEADKEYLGGFKHATEELENFKANIGMFIAQDVPTLRRIEEELSLLVINNAIDWLNSTHDEILISFVENNHYSIDENGNIVDDNEKPEE